MTVAAREVLVAVFSSGERTLELCLYCLTQLGFCRFLVLEGKDGFRDKFLRFASAALDSGEGDCFLKVDGDCLVFDGILEVIHRQNQTGSFCAEGLYYDFVMNRIRQGTPHVYSRFALEALVAEPHLMRDSQRPEDGFQENLERLHGLQRLYLSVLTNLHEFEQYPSKVCNSYLNRLYRRNGHLYDPAYLAGLPAGYRRAIEHARAVRESLPLKASMSYLGLDFLDEGTSSLTRDELPSMYLSHHALYRQLCALVSRHPDPRNQPVPRHELAPPGR